MRIRPEILVTAVVFAGLSQPMTDSQSPDHRAFRRGRSVRREMAAFRYAPRHLSPWQARRAREVTMQDILYSSASVPVRMEGAPHAAGLA